jgi:pimeloyl-ACP methyl ester carboxylesterase
MLRRWLLIITMLLALLAGYALFTNDARVVPYRNTAQYWALRWLGMLDSASSAARGTLHGTVRTPLGQPIRNATVLLPQIDGTAWSAETDGAGRYMLAVPPGSYVPVAGAPGYDDAAIHTLLGIGVTENAQTRLDITLQPRQDRAVPPPQNVQIGALQAYTIEKPLPGTAIRREIKYTVGGQPNQQTLYYTPNDGKTTTLPTLLAVYPGPADTWERVSLPLAQAGYAVIAVGPAYALDLEPDVDDLERLIAMARDGTLPRADGTRIGALGGSYSGLHVFRLAARDPDAIQAALLLGPPTDAFDLRQRFEADEFHPPFGLDQVLIALGLPDRAPERYWRYSARYHARDITIPLLLAHSKADEVVPFEQSELLAQELTRLGKPHELQILEGLDHFYLLAPERTPAIDALFTTTLQFFEKQLAVRAE